MNHEDLVGAFTELTAQLFLGALHEEKLPGARSKNNQHF